MAAGGVHDVAVKASPLIFALGAHKSKLENIWHRRKIQLSTGQGPPAAGSDPTADARDPRWTTQRAVGCAAFVVRYISGCGRRSLVAVPSQLQALGARQVSVSLSLLRLVSEQRNESPLALI